MLGEGNGPERSYSCSASCLLWPALSFLSGIDVEPVADHPELFGFDIAHDVDEDGLLASVEHGHHHALDRVPSPHFKVNAHVLLFLLCADDFLPTVGVELGPNGADAILDFIAVAVVEPHHIDPDGAKPLEQVRNLGLVLLHELRDHGNEVAAHVDFHRLVARGRIGKFAEVYIAGGRASCARRTERRRAKPQPRGKEKCVYS